MRSNIHTAKWSLFDKIIEVLLTTKLYYCLKLLIIRLHGVVDNFSGKPLGCYIRVFSYIFIIKDNEDQLQDLNDQKKIARLMIFFKEKNTIFFIKYFRLVNKNVNIIKRNIRYSE